MAKEQRTFEDAYAFHGLELTAATGGQVKSDCPFCGKEDHLYISQDRGLFDCKVCGAQGNLQTFLAKIIDASIESTNEEEYQELITSRSLLQSTFEEFRICKSFLRDSWLLPSYDEEGKLKNIHLWGTNKQLYSTPTCKQTLFGLDKLNENADIIWLCEGHWDALALYQCFKQLKKKNGQTLLNTNSVLGVPGASIFNNDWCKLFIDKTLIIAYDNDKAGKDGLEKVLNTISQSEYKPNEAYLIDWKTNDPKDIRDFFIHNKRSALKTVKGLEERKEKAASYSLSSHIPAIQCDSFDELSKSFEEHLHITPAFMQTLATMLAVNISTNMESDPVWMYVIGPPSSGKSTLAECLSANRLHCLAMSKLTGFHSGFQREGQDASLIPTIQGKTVIVKDGTAMLHLPGPTQDQVFGELRDIFDGSSSAHYRNMKKSEYANIKTTFIICTTDEIRSYNRSSLGERFLCIEIMDHQDSITEGIIIEKALSNTINRLSQSFAQAEEQTDINKLKSLTSGYIKHLHSSYASLPMPKITAAQITDIGRMAKLSAMCRTKVRRDRQHNLVYRPRPELGIRLANQLTKLAICLALVLNKTKVDEEVFDILRKVTWDTSKGFQLDCLQAIYGGANLKGDILKSLKLSDSKVDYLLEDMSQLGMIEKNSLQNRTGIGRGRINRWELSTEMTSLCQIFFK
jgi:hypothetical protein